MTISEAIATLDSLQRNTYSDHDKVRWLSELDAMVKTQIFDTHEGEFPPFGGYDDDTDRATALLLGEPFEGIYLRYLEAKLHYHDEEYDRYNNAMGMFQTLWDGCCSHYNRCHRPKGQKLRYF